MTPFARGLADEIAANGPMPFERWMALCNAHYYATRNPLGRDFTTAPEISQVFGELIGLWAADLWARAGAPPRVAMVELGPGRGTLMADALRATARVPGFAAARAVHFVDTSAVLRAAQAARVPHATWHAGIETLPTDTPLIVLANEFLDALPISICVRTAQGWRERGVALDGNAFAFVDSAPGHDETISQPAFGVSLPEREGLGAGSAPQAGREPTHPQPLPFREGSSAIGADRAIHEHSPAAEALVQVIAQRIATQGGAALFIDYGHTAHALGDTVQAVRDGGRVPVLAHPGEADLTAHVDFAAIAEAAHPHARIHGPTTQAQFLTRLGLAERTDALARPNPARAAALHAAAARLTAPAQMGALFKALALTHPDWPTPAGFAR